MKKLKVDFEQIGWAMEDQSRDISEYYLDKETGEVVIVSDKVLRVVEDGDSLDDLADWQQDEARVAREILLDSPDRYERIPEKPSYEGYNLMVDFAEDIENEVLREKLSIALDGPGAFRRFKNVLSDYPDYREKWFRFKQEKFKEEITDWLETLGIEPQE